jgi:CheY-like chemotaxis protein
MLAKGMNDLLERTIGPQVVKIWQLDESSPWVMADAHQLELAILNLAINARDAMPRGGELTIRTATSEAGTAALPEGPYGIISVSDNGSGIPQHLVSKVFDPFFTTKGIGKGTGLGLSQVFGIAEQSGGTAQLTSEEGVGTTVSIWLPLTQPEIRLGTIAPADAVASRANGHVLVIDDEDGVRRFLVDCLETLGYQVREAENGKSGLSLLERERPDLLIVDFAMAGMNGMDVVKEAHRREPDLPVILATGYAEIDTGDDAAGNISILRKPFKISDLKDALALAMENSSPALRRP